MLTYRFGYLIFFYVLWLVKNVMTTSCLAFPIYLSCISSLDWHNSNLIKQEYLELQEFHRSFSNYNSLDIWIESWTENVINQTVLFNFTITLSIIVLFLIMYSINPFYFSIGYFHVANLLPIGSPFSYYYQNFFLK